MRHLTRLGTLLLLLLAWTTAALGAAVDPSTGRAPARHPTRPAPLDQVAVAGEIVGYTTNSVILHYRTLADPEFDVARTDLIATGHTLVPVNDLNPGTLAGLDWLVVGVVKEGFAMTATQVDAIEAFVLGGGKLLFLGENNYYFRDNNVAVGGRFGISYPPPGGDPIQSVLDIVASHPIMQGPFGNVTVVDGSNNAATFYGSMASPGPHGSSILSFDNGASACVVIEPGELGPTSGLVVAVAEVNIWDPGQIDVADNREFWNNIFAYDPTTNQPPDCSSARASIEELWPPNHELVPVGITGVVDPEGNPVTITVTGVTQDEAVNGLGDGDTCPDAVADRGGIQLRAERAGSGNGRVYVVSFLAEDGLGGACEGRVAVCVPHDRGRAGACVDDGQAHDSMGPCGSGTLANRGGLRVGFARGRARTALLEYTVSRDGDVEIGIFDVAGRRVATLVDRRQPAGTYQVHWDAVGRASGVYFARLRAGDTIDSKALVVLR